MSEAGLIRRYEQMSKEPIADVKSDILYAAGRAVGDAEKTL